MLSLFLFARRNYLDDDHLKVVMILKSAQRKFPVLKWPYSYVVTIDHLIAC